MSLFAFYRMAVSNEGATRRIEYIDDSIFDILNITPEQVIADSSYLYRAIIEKDRILFRDYQDQAYQYESTFACQFKAHIIETDELKTIQIFSSKEQTDANGVQYWKGFIVDVTNSNTLQNDLIVSPSPNETLFENTFESAAIGLAHVSVQGEIIRVNQRFADFFGYDKTQLLSINFIQLTAEEDRAKSFEAVKQLLSEEFPDTVQLRKRYVTSSKKVVWGNVMISLIRNHNNQPDYFITALADISETIQLESALKLKQQELRSLIDHADIWLSSFDRDIRYLHVNQKYSDTFGLTVEEIEGKCANQVLPPDIYQQHYSLIQDCFKGKKVAFDTELHLPDEVRYTSGIYTPIINRDKNTVDLAVVAVTDVTEQVKLTKALERSDNLFSALSQNLPRLFESEFIHDSLDVLVTELGKAANVSRSYLFQIETTESDFLATQLNEWVNEGIKSQSEYDDHTSVPMIREGMGSIVELFLNNQVLNSTVSSLPESARAFLAQQDIKTLIAVPIYVNSQWWGFLGFDDCITEQAWSETEVNTLVICANSISSALGFQHLKQEKLELEKAAKLSEERIRDSLEAAEHGVWDWDMTTNKVYYSPIWKAMLGFQEDEISDALSEFEGRVHPEDLSVVWGLIDDHMKQKTSGFKAEFRMQSKNGDWIWILAHGRALDRNDQGQPKRLTGTHTDITVFKQTELALRKSEENFRQLFEGNKAVELIIDPNTGQIINANKAAELFYGYPLNILKTLNISSINTLSSKTIKREMNAAKNEFRSIFNFCHRLASGELRDVEVHSGPVFYNDQECLYSIIVDVTEKKKAQESLILSRKVFENAYDGIMVCDASVKILDVNPTFTKITGYSKEEVIGKNPNFLSSGRQTKAFYQSMWNEILTKGYWSGELWNVNKFNDYYIIQSTISTIKDETGQISHFISTFSDISDLKQHQKQLEILAHFDPLTQLPNRNLLSDRLNQAIAHANRSTTSLAVCFLDLDNFKYFNDLYGHNVGDQVLVKLSERLKTFLRKEDTIARLGGDEFIILIGDIKRPEDLSAMADKLLEVVSQRAMIEAHQILLSGSLGISVYPQDNSDADTLIRHADQAMYQAKVQGKNCFKLFDMDADEADVQRHQSISRIKKAIEEGELELFYQPKANLLTGELVGFEALIRWNHPEKGLTFPDDFLPVISGHEVEKEIDNWVLVSSINQLKRWKKQGLLIPISINISGHSLFNNQFIDQVEKTFETNSDLLPHLLQVEVLESATLNDINVVKENLKILRSIGVEVALDDFGTGYSSLSYLKSLPANTLKIDKNFIRDMLIDASDKAIVEGIIQLADVFSLAVLAEGVETIEIAQVLKNLGCHLIQGYWLSRPVPIEEANRIISEWDNKKIKL